MSIGTLPPAPPARGRIALLGLLTLLGLAVVLVKPALGSQDQTVQPNPIAASTVCDVAPRTFEEITRLIRLGRSHEQVAGLPSGGASARPATMDEVGAVLKRFVACSGAGEPLRVWSLYTDGYLSRLLSRERGYDRVRYDLDSEPHPVAASDWPELTALAGTGIDRSGRIVADATIHYPNLDRTKLVRFWFAWQDGQLRIDEVDGEITFALP